MPEKVLIITTVHYPFDNRIFYKQAKTLVDAGYDVTLIAQHTKNETIDGIKIIGLKKARNRFERMFLLTFKSFFIAIREKSFICHVHDPELIFIGFLLKLFTRRKVVYDIHEEFVQKIRGKHWLPLRLPISNFYKRMEKILCKYYDYIITATEKINHDISNDNKIAVKNYPVVEMFNINTKKKDEYVKLIYTGGFTRNRGIYQIVRALNLIYDKNVKLLLFGKNNDQEFKNEVISLPGYSKVDYLGFVPFDEIVMYLSTADIGLVCNQPLYSYNESMPNKLFEYMIAGLPIIASNFSAWIEIIEGNYCGITIDPTNEEEIASAINYLIKNPDVRAEMGKNGQKAAYNKYNWSNEANKLLNVYKELSS